MRTTVSLDSDVQALLERAMSERGITFKQAINDAVRAGLVASAARADLHFPTFAMGSAPNEMDHALRLAGELEDAETAREMELGR